MRWFSSQVGTLVLALSAVALGACADRPKPTEASPPAGPDPLIIIGGGGGDEVPPPPAPITIGSLTSADFEVAIDGPSVPYTATLNNPGPQRPNVALQGWITQGATRRAAGGQLVTCGLSAGVMPIGNCTAAGPDRGVQHDCGERGVRPRQRDIRAAAETGWGGRGLQDRRRHPRA